MGSERIIEESKIQYIQTQNEKNITEDCLKYMKSDLLPYICYLYVFNDLEDCIVRAREEKKMLLLQKQQHELKSSKLQRSGGGNSKDDLLYRKELPDYYFIYPKKKISKNQ